MRQGCSKKRFKGEEPQMCCSGRDCGCMGMPTEPIICSRRCWKKFVRDSRKRTEEFQKQQEQNYYEEQAAYEEQWQTEMRACYE